MIDVMHTEKNIAENCVGTMLNEKGKSKDNARARHDLVDMGIRPTLQPVALMVRHICLLPAMQ